MSDQHLFEFDPLKAHSNELKHGVAFAEVEAVFYDPLGLTQSDGDAQGEERQITLGCDAKGRLLVVIWTWRGETIRLISARRATKNERKTYEA